MVFKNSYRDEIRANAYAKLEFHNTYYLAFRDLPHLFKKYIKGNKAFDFGCGTGRSTRFLQKHGFNAIGIDISKEMIKNAKKINPKGRYYLIKDGVFNQFNNNSYDLILSAFTFDNIPIDKKAYLLSGLSKLLKKHGKIINIVSSPEIYTHEWATFSTKDFPENKNAKSGDIVPIITTDFEDKRPCYDIFCSSQTYKKIYQSVGMNVIHLIKPLADGSEPYQWVNETHLSPWNIYVLEKNLEKLENSFSTQFKK